MRGARLVIIFAGILGKLSQTRLRAWHYEKFNPDNYSGHMLAHRIVHVDFALSWLSVEYISSVLFFLQHQSVVKPISLYINCPGAESQSAGIALYDVLKSLQCPVHTTCVGTAHGEAALLLASGRRGQRGVLPSASIMLRAALHGMGRAPVDDVEVFRREIRHNDDVMVELLAKECDQSPVKLRQDTRRATYLTPYEARDYGLVDHVLEPRDPVFRDLVRHWRGGGFVGGASADGGAGTGEGDEAVGGKSMTRPDGGSVADSSDASASRQFNE
ncbi:Clp protease [Helicosporidium sp. ATCC 50920]|nr:Clp protease [Helicosporidium sp. ATCC 50920]|eukprot:KDD75448.1 Clp protease [Helicosporidium sp. ATCC 50920]